MQVIPVGESSVVLIVSYDTTARCAAEIRNIYRKLKRLQMPGILSLRPGLDSILLEYSELFDLDKALNALEQSEEPAETTVRTIRVPVCYELGIDLPEIAQATALTGKQIAELHCSRTYNVWMIGFMPGFPYIGELPAELRLSRKNRPAQNIPRGSVAIADEYTGIYSFDSPGGWNVIGRTPLKLIDYSADPFCLFTYDMNVQFYPISKDEFNAEPQR